jgi:hypothetical protein
MADGARTSTMLSSPRHCTHHNFTSLRYWPSTDSGYLNEQMTSLSGKVTDVSSGGEYTTQSWCAVVDHKKVECWGSNGFGQLVS